MCSKNKDYIRLFCSFVFFLIIGCNRELVVQPKKIQLFCKQLDQSANTMRTTAEEKILEMNGFRFGNGNFKVIEEGKSESTEVLIEDVAFWFNRKSSNNASALGLIDMDSLARSLKSGLVSNNTTNNESTALICLFGCFESTMNYRFRTKTLLMTGKGISGDMNVMLLCLQTKKILVLNVIGKQEDQVIVLAGLALQDAFINKPPEKP